MTNTAKRPVNNKGKGKGKKGPVLNQNFRFMLTWFLVVFGMWYLLKLNAESFEGAGGMPLAMTYGEFYEMAKDNSNTGRISAVIMTENVLKGALSDGRVFRVIIPQDDPDLMRILRENISKFEVRPPAFLSSLFWSTLPMMLFIGFLWLMFYRGAQGGGRILAFGKSRARLVTPDMPKVTFNDVAGVDEAKEELNEVIEFLKDPKKFQRLGGKIPKGVLLMGPPGCGKTILARAVSAEAGAPFLSISGSDFVEMFVGVGASRVRDLFEQARRSAKASGRGCIIFIDEIDAVGRQRFAGIGGGHDEREQTLNALLVELDGFDAHAGIILIAASNRPDVLDPALLRPGRFDRIIVVERPDLNGREAILKVHTRNIKLAKSVQLRGIAKQTPGFSGADLANLANEAALLAARKHDRDSVTTQDLEEAIERVMAGPEKKGRVINPDEKKIIAYHESGHALVSLLIPEADPLHKVSILPRGIALGYTLNPPSEDRHIKSKSKLMSEITVALGGRASEEITFGETSTGAHSDIQAITNIARQMVQRYGMSQKLGHLAFGRRYENIFLGRDFGEERDYSDQTARIIDEEIKKIVDDCYKKAKELLSENRQKLDSLALALLEKEVLGAEEVKEIVGLNACVEKDTQ